MTKEELVRENETLRSLLNQIQESITDAVDTDDDEEEGEIGYEE